ncbi:MAG: primosomal protein N' [Candidatus Doudnabacteria bacterium]|nr:primosomal protein N' [Candidatus Doudnabacteria bacterium]
MSEFKKIINVIPLTRIGLGRSQIYSYLVPLNLQGFLRPGQLVKIPLGTRDSFGVTSSFEMYRLAPEIKGYKSLDGLVDSTPVISEKNLALANWIANHCVASLGIVVKSMISFHAVKAKTPELIGYEKFDPDYVLTEHQRAALSRIVNFLDTNSTFLVHGVTGSGKTEIYMRVMQRILERGKQAIMLVPEISLTSQAIERFARRFGMDRIAFLHSRLRPSEKSWMWEKIRLQEKQIIIGPRSAVFAPVQNLGLIILDEEHDSSFKQYDQNPKYHARSVAKKLAELWNCPLLLGDATPSVETYHEAVTGQGVLLTLPHRIKADIGLPRVTVIDMRKEIARGNFSILSEFLKLSILDHLKNGKQILLFLNRRGSATFVMCRDCGHVATCGNCASNLVWHSFSKKLLCHHCGRDYPYPELCPRCGGARIKHFGVGTQAVEEELGKFLKKELKQKKQPAVSRMDSDSVATRGAAGKIYEEWSAGKIDILIGTQIISKGWDISRVGLVGVISADTFLHLPDFRSNERTFQVLTQVAGRAGRGADKGLVIVQTYNPENMAIESAKMHDYEKFFKIEIRERKRLGYPPFSQLVKLTFRHEKADTAKERAGVAVQGFLKKKVGGVEILGPVPAFISKLRGKYQFQVILKLEPSLSVDLYGYLRDISADVDIDVDPESLL